MTKVSTTAFGGTYSPAPSLGTAVNNAYLIIFTDIKSEASIVKIEGNMTLGREIPGLKPDIAVNSPIVSRKHGEFTVSGGCVYYQDCGSFNGTYVNGALYKKDVNPDSAPVRLNDGDVLRIDNRHETKSHDNAVTIVFTTTYDKRSKWRREKTKSDTASIGLSAKKFVEFNTKKMVQQMAVAGMNEVGCALRNVGKAHHLVYNNCLAGETCFVRNKDIFRIDKTYFYYDKGEFLYNVCLVTEPGLDISLQETYVADKLKKKVLLKDIDLSIDKGDFALIIGGSGAGKSTFMNSVLGKYDIHGSISIGGKKSEGPGDLTSGIAYVPQTLPLRKEERLIDVVTDTCILRNKKKMTKFERDKFILDSLDSLGLKSKANMEIKKLSGGEQRRAAIANEVVTNSEIFFLDEPDSGLDPKSGMELMNNLKALSDVGKIVMLISHNYASYPCPERIYTKIIILAKSNKDGIGRLAFCGSVTEALEFFGVDALKDITKLINPVSENGEGRADEFVEKYRRTRGHG